MAQITVRWDAPTQTFLAKTEHGDYREYGQGATEREALDMLVSALTLTVVVMRDQRTQDAASGETA